MNVQLTNMVQQPIWNELTKLAIQLQSRDPMIYQL